MGFKPYIQLWGETVGRTYVRNLRKAAAVHPATKSKDKKSSSASTKKSSSADKTKRRTRSIIRKKHSGVKNLSNPRVSTSRQASLITRRVPKSTLT